MNTLRKKLLLPLLTLLILCLFPVSAQAADVAAPANVQATLQSGGSVYVSWDSTPCDYYELYVADTADEYSTEYYYPESNSITLPLDSGYHYIFQVRSIVYDEEYGEEIYSAFSEPAYLEYRVKAPAGFSAKSTGPDKVELSWDYDYEPDGYKIYRSTSKNGAYKVIADLDYSETSYTDTDVSVGKTYYYKMTSYSYYRPLESKFTAVKSVTPTLKTPTLKAAAASYTSIKLSWKKDSLASGYKIYRASSKDGTYECIKTIKDPSTVSYTNGKRTIGKRYYYKMRSYIKIGDKTLYSKYSSVISAVPSVVKTKITSIKLNGVTKVDMKWEKVSGAHGYAIYRSTEKDGTYKRIKTIKSGKTLTCTIGGQKNGYTYYYKIRAYRTVNDKNYYGEYCSIKKKLMNKLGYAGELYEARCKRIWGTDYYKHYSSASAASKDMKTIKVKVWDINSSKKKYTRTFSLTVHKNIAATVQQIFKEIYEGPEKFPIHSLGGYSWRGDSSDSEHCEGLALDINPNENPMIDKTTGKVLSGKAYRPGKDPYSIPADGDVVKAFEKYGFSWGNWSTKADYMHFSYFGT